MARIVGRRMLGMGMIPLLIGVLLLVIGGTTWVVLLRNDPVGPAGDAGGGAAVGTPLTAWIDAAIAGDYATARTLTNDPDFVFGVWQDRTEKARGAGHLQSYRMVTEEQRGATTAYQVQFEGGDTPHCMVLLVDDHGKVSAPYPYQPGTCRLQGID